MYLFKDKEETGSGENESDSNSTTTPKTIVSATVKPGSPTTSIGSDTIIDRQSANRQAARRAVTPVSPLEKLLTFGFYTIKLESLG